MRKQLSALAKRALAFTLALVLLLALVPAGSLTVKAAYDENGWEYFGSYTWLGGRFHTDNADLIYEDDEPYDWKVSIYQGRTTANLTVSATIKDKNGKTVVEDTKGFKTKDYIIKRKLMLWLYRIRLKEI